MGQLNKKNKENYEAYFFFKKITSNDENKKRK